jgi:hypothetical protein
MTSPGAARSSSSTYSARAEPQQFAAIHGLPRYRTVRRQRQPVRLLRKTRLAQEGSPYKCRLGTPGCNPEREGGGPDFHHFEPIDRLVAAD